MEIKVKSRRFGESAGFVKAMACHIRFFKLIRLYRVRPVSREINLYKRLLLENEGLDCEFKEIMSGGSGDFDSVFLGYDITVNE